MEAAELRVYGGHERPLVLAPVPRRGDAVQSIVHLRVQDVEAVSQIHVAMGVRIRLDRDGSRRAKEHRRRPR
ncbi:MAG: hypothetical protein F4169_20985 [Gammaproteobacteria bacterium]|nr:hypothetical protein [Gammaproteobacteria bacterium]